MLAQALVLLPNTSVKRCPLLVLVPVSIVLTILSAQSVEPARETNSLGMVFVAVPGTTVAFSIWETRVQDYAVFVNEGQWGRLWPRKPDFQQETNHPVVNVSWNDAKDFCVWLTKREHDAGRLNKHQVYRLPTDREWSAAVGLPRESGRTAESRRGGPINHYPFGQFRLRNDAHGAEGGVIDLPKGVGNYAGAADGYKHTAPVGSFKPNALGIYDLGGNVWEWCIDFADDGRRNVLRGGSWYGTPVVSGVRDFTLPDGEVGNFGFRCVRADAPATLD
jgi:formylglycine-generating enzyme required for sulfatase activity